MQIQLLTRVPSAKVREMAQAAAERDEPLDQCNVFPIGTSQHTTFSNAWLMQMLAMARSTSHGEFPEFEILTGEEA